MRFTWMIIFFVSLLSCGEDKSSKDDATEQPKAPTLPIKESIDTALAGSWVLTGLPQAAQSFDKLYSRQHPVIFIQPQSRLISGSTGCNRFSATISTIGHMLKFTDFTSSTLRCESEAESNFLRAWENAHTYKFNNSDEMVWGTDSVNWMIFKRR